jgi:nitrogen regulatory protein P-II 1
MKKMDIILRPGREDDLRALLDGFGVPGITVSHVLGYGEQRGRKEMYRGTEVESRLLSKLRFEIVLKDEQVEPLAELLVKTLSTGTIGDGKIFISDIASVIKIRTGEREC